MFDKLIESNSAGAEFKPRRKFFMVSSVVVGIVFLSAVVASLYAHDISLGTDDFELVQILAPTETDVPEPEPPRQQPRQRNDQTTSQLPSRRDLFARIDQPQEPPTSISTTPNTGKSIPVGAFQVNPLGPETDGSGPVGPVGTQGGASSSVGTEIVADVGKVPEPPPAAAKPEPKKPVTRTKGVVNGDAIDLPKPPYPQIARMTNITGTVNVQVLIDVTGEVISAKAIDGHPFFKVEAERAAKRARFKPTTLSDQPVKVNGIIVYRFTK